jgi:hypothetical protein
MHTYIHAYIPTYAYTNTHTHTHTYIHIYIHGYTHTCKYAHGFEFHQDITVRNICKDFPECFRFVVYVKKAYSTDLAWNSFVMPFSLGVWVSLIGCLLTLSVAFLLLDRFWPQHRRQEGLLLEFPRALFSVMRSFCSQGAVLIWVMNLNWALTKPAALTFSFNSDCSGSSPHDLRIVTLYLRAKVQNRNSSLGSKEDYRLSVF